MIQLQNIHKSFGANAVLRGIDLAAPTGSVAVILGPSGSGKTTLLRTINFLERAERGRIVIDDLCVDIATCHKRDVKRLRRETAMVFQAYNLFHNMTALENVMAGLTVVRKLPVKEARETAERCLEDVGLLARENAYPYQLSGGQQQRVGIARALALSPKVLLFDEPTSSLDPELVGEVLEVMRKVAAMHTSTMIVVTHEIGFARDVADQAIFMDNGVVVERGPPEEVLGRPREARTIQFLARYKHLQPEYAI
jgi:L-cystine transport system ATP-binding protein